MTAPRRSRLICRMKVVAAAVCAPGILAVLAWVGVATAAEPTGTPVIRGEPVVGTTLTADVSDVHDRDGGIASVTYQWHRVSGTKQGYYLCVNDACKDIPGAHASTYVPTREDIGWHTGVLITVTDGEGNTHNMRPRAPGRVRAGVVTASERVLSVPEGGSDTYTVALRRAPTGTVTVDISGAAGTDVQVHPESLTFTGDDWSTAQTVTVTVTDDADAVSDGRVTLLHRPSGGGLDGEGGDPVTVLPGEEDGSLVATLAHAPAKHDGSSPFTFTVSFGREVAVTDMAMRAEVFAVAEGSITDARRTAPPSNAAWRIEIRPTFYADVVVSLPATVDCATVGAVCTAGGLKLTGDTSLTVLGEWKVKGVWSRSGAGYVIVGWTPLAGAARYYVQWRSGSETFDTAAADGRETAPPGTSPEVTIGLLTRRTYWFRVIGVAADGTESVPSAATQDRPLSLPPLPPPPPPPPPGGNSGSGGGSGSSGGSSQDAHGNNPAQATVVTPQATAPWHSAIPGQVNSASDVDYFTVLLPQAGVLVVETTGATATVGTVWQAGAELGSADSDGAEQNFRLSVPVTAGPVVLAVAGQGGRTGAYTLRTRLVVGYLENPGADSFQSGIGVLSGWVCAAETVTLELDGVAHVAAYGTERGDTQGECGDTDNGFGLLFNWNLVGAGEHAVVAYVDDIELGRATVTVTTLGAEFLRDVAGSCPVEDFPMVGETVTLVWQQNSQNFVIAEGSPPAGVTTGRTSALTGYLENPGHNSFQGGVGVLSGWVCEAEEVVIAIGTLAPQVAAYGTERLDTQDACGDTDNGFGLLFNWNLLGDGEHEVVAYVDDEELGRATVQVTTLGQEFLRGAEGECVVPDFPTPGETVTLEWQQNSQNFVIVSHDPDGAGP